MTLPAFKRNPVCPKCGHDGIVFDYKAAKENADEDRRIASCGMTSDPHFEEHIHLECNRCSYGKNLVWIMSVAESPERLVGFRQRAVA